MHPVAYSADYQGDDRSRRSVFFRVFVVIPWLIVGFFYAIAAYIALIASRFLGSGGDGGGFPNLTSQTAGPAGL